MHIDHDGLVLSNESDVEVKVLQPLLQGAAYLDIPEKAIKPKKYLAPTPFNRKAGATSGSYPDFSVWFRSFPCLIVEAKSPEVPCEQGYHEAALYAAYLNQNYPTGINPAYFILASNGIDFMAGYWDARPTLSGPVSDLRPKAQLLADLQRICGRNQLNAHAMKCLAASSAKHFILPYNLAGGQRLVAEGAFSTLLDGQANSTGRNAGFCGHSQLIAEASPAPLIIFVLVAAALWAKQASGVIHTAFPAEIEAWSGAVEEPLA